MSLESFASEQFLAAPKSWPNRIFWLLFGFKGEIGRKAFWIGTGLYIGLLGILGFLIALVFSNPAPLKPLIMVLPPISLIIGIWPQIALLGKRFQDAGWWGILAWLALVLGPIVILIAGCLPRKSSAAQSG